MPRYGFNFLWLFTGAYGDQRADPDERALDFLVAHGFDFVRLPMTYRLWTRGLDYLEPDERVLEHVDRCVEACTSRGLHVSLNLHRAPGYCINDNESERHNLWVDEVAQDAFVFLWEHWAERYRTLGPEVLSFDLLNEPPHVGQYGLTRDNHEALIRRTVAAIRTTDPDRAIVIDGLGAGNLAMPELADLGVMHSGRGYQPIGVSHYRAPWMAEYQGTHQAEYPCRDWDGRPWDRQGLLDSYQPWREVEGAGATVHIGEFGCYSATPNDVALRWLSDLVGIYRELGWGYALWNFQGAFGIVEHGRPGTRYELVDGYRIDRALLELLIEGRAA